MRRRCRIPFAFQAKGALNRFLYEKPSATEACRLLYLLPLQTQAR